MDIKSLLIPSYLNELEGQKADIEQSKSATNLNNIQAGRVASLLPGELRRQGLDIEGAEIGNRGAELDNQGKALGLGQKALEMEGQSILNRINSLKIKGTRFENQKLEVEAGAAETNMKLAQEAQKMQILAQKAQIGQAAAMTRKAISDMNLNQRKMFMEEAYPKAASSINLVKRLADSGDLGAANKVYQQLLKTLPPEFLQFEGKNGVDLLGPEIDPKDLPLLDQFSTYLNEMVPADSQLGRIIQRREVDDAALNRAEIQASSEQDPLKRRKLELEVEAKEEEKISNSLLQGITGGSANKRKAFDVSGEPVDPVTSYGYNKIKELAKQADREGLNGVEKLTKAFTLDTTDDLGPSEIELDNIILPRKKEHRELFVKVMENIKKDQGLSDEEAYQQALDLYLNEPSVIKSIFEE